MKNWVWVLSLLVTAGCSCSSNYHKLATEGNLGLKHDGVIVGIEKYNWGCVNKKRGVDHSRYKIETPGTITADKFEFLVNQKKAMIVSHIIGFKNDVRNDFYNPFITQKGTKPEYEQGYAQLDKLRDKLVSDLQEGDYTHLIFMSMGWHNDQYESIRRYNEIISKIEKRDANNKFKPYVVAVTWPSSWGSDAKLGLLEKLGHITSYLNKPNDADEIGFTVSNYLLHNVILAAVNEVNGKGSNIKTVAIGHSLGARLISRAIFSRGFLKNDKSNSTYPDLFIGLEPAFSANRFISNGGIEGYPYSTHSEIKTKFIVTTSKLDKANPVAFWSEHMGGKDAWDTVKENLNDFNFYDVEIKDGRIFGLDPGSLWRTPKKVEYVNCLFIDEHNDILDDEMGLFLFEIINNSGV